MPLGGVDNLFSDALNEFFVANYFRGDHSNVVPVVPAVLHINSVHLKHYDSFSLMTNGDFDDIWSSLYQFILSFCHCIGTGISEVTILIQ